MRFVFYSKVGLETFSSKENIILLNLQHASSTIPAFLLISRVEERTLDYRTRESRYSITFFFSKTCNRLERKFWSEKYVISILIFLSNMEYNGKGNVWDVP